MARSLLFSIFESIFNPARRLAYSLVVVLFVSQLALGATPVMAQATGSAAGAAGSAGSELGIIQAPAATTSYCHDPDGPDGDADDLPHSIAGNAGIGGAILSYTDGTDKTAKADPTGAYWFRVAPCWSGTVTPSFANTTFTPASRTYTYLVRDVDEQDYTATQQQGGVFGDVPVPGQEWMEPYILALYNLRIVTPCSTTPLLYCPSRDATRAEAAVYVLRALHGSSYEPPAASHFFADVPVAGKEWMEPWLDEYYREGLTIGCGANPLIFCPEANVTRAEMAVFILRATHPADWAPASATGIFSDVPVIGKEWMQPWIEAFYNEGISTGCGSSPLMYCPEAKTSRADIAVFLGRAFHLYP